MRIENRDVPFTETYVDIDKLKLDPRNPRIQQELGVRGGVSEEELEQILWDRDQVKTLMASIKDNGGIRESIIVREINGQLIVAEGNQRTVASRKLCKTEGPGSKFCKIPAIVFDSKLTDAELAVVLAEIHVAGKDKWDAYEKARHIWELNTVHGKNLEWLTIRLRMSKSAVSMILGSYRAMTEYLASHPADRITKYSFFQELYKKKDLKERYENDNAFKDSFRRWVHEDRLTDPRQVRHLEAALDSPRARAELESSGMRAAEAVLRNEDPASEAGIYATIKRATESLKAFPLMETSDLKVGNIPKIMILRDLNRALQDVALAAGITL